MSKIECHCGNTISDTTDSIPWKASFLPDEYEIAFSEAVSGGLAAVAEGREDVRSFAVRVFGVDSVQATLDAESILADYLTSLALRYRRTAYECTKCGRLWIEGRTGSNRFWCYTPASGTYEGVLRGP